MFLLLLVGFRTHYLEDYSSEGCQALVKLASDYQTYFDPDGSTSTTKFWNEILGKLKPSPKKAKKT